MNNIQYNAAIKYLEKNSYRVNKSNAMFTIFFIGIISYFLVLYFIKITSCIR